MATLLSPNSPSSVVAPQPKKGVFSSSTTSSSRRPSTSSGSGGLSPHGIGYSPGSSTSITSPPSPAGSGIPAFRTLRSLLPFGPSSSSKNATPSSSSSTSTPPNTSRSPFANFGSVRRSMTRDRERKTSLSNDVLTTPVIAIERSPGPLADDTAIRRSASLSRIEKPLPSEPDIDNLSPPFHESGPLTLGNNIFGSGFPLRTPSPGPPLSAELSTIIEADSSGVSRNLPDPDGIPTHPYPQSRSSSPAPPRIVVRDFLQPHRQSSSGSGGGGYSYITPNHARTDSADFDFDADADASALDLSMSDVADQVRDALRKSTASSKSGEEWRHADKAVVIDADDVAVADTTFNLDTLDPDLMALLSPNSGLRSKNPSSHSVHRTGSADPRQPSSASPSPTTPSFPPSPASRLPRARQSSSFLPRLRSSNSNSPSPSPTSPKFSMPTPSPTTPSMRTPTTPKASPANTNTNTRTRTPPRPPAIAVNGDDYSPISPPGSPASPALASAPTSTPVSRRTMNPPRSMRMFSPPSSRTTKVFGGLMRNTAEDRTPPNPNPNPNSNSNSNSNTADPSKPPRLATRTLRQVMLGTGKAKDGDSLSSVGAGAGTTSASVSVSVSVSPTRTTPLSRGSLDSRRPPTSSSSVNDIGLGRPSLEIRRGSFDSRTRPSTSTSSTTRDRDRDTFPYLSRSSTSPERTGTGPTTATPTTTEAESSPSPEVPFDEPEPFYRPSFDSTNGGRPSFDSSSRPSSVALARRDKDKDKDRDKRTPPSAARVPDPGSEARASPVPRGPPSARVRKRSMSVQERIAKGRFGGAASESGGGGGGGVSRAGSSLSVHGGGGRGVRGAGFGLEGGGGAGGHESAGHGPKTEWLGPRTAKAFKAAGLLDFERDREKEREREREGSDTTERLRDMSGGVPSPSPLGGGGGGAGGSASALTRFGSFRSTSEYNPSQHTRALSRMAFSEAGGGSSGIPGRRGSGSFSAYGGGSQYGGYTGLIESPTFTVSSGSRDRDTPKSTVSTAPTSVSESFGYLGRDRTERDRERERDRDRDRDRDEIREMREKHATEMGALISALSDSQRTVRMLREENSQLRERLDHASIMMQENNELRHAFDSVERECAGLRRELTSLRAVKAPGLMPSWSGSSGTSSASGFRTPIPRPGNSSPLVMDSTPSFVHRQEEEEEEEAEEAEEELFSDTIIIHDSIDDDDGPPYLGDHNNAGLSLSASGTSRPASESTPSIKRRLSNSSSIFPIPPSNMTMLLHEDSTSHLGSGLGSGLGGGGSNRSSADQSQFHFSLPANHHHNHHHHAPISMTKPIATPQPRPHPLSQSPAVTYRNFAGPGHVNNKSVTSTTSISPTTANFSMVTGSPGSLFLRPEHEILLGDMESLDLGVRGADGEGEGEDPNRLPGDDDGW